MLWLPLPSFDGMAAIGVKYRSLSALSLDDVPSDMTPNEGSQQEETPLLGSALCLFVGRGESSRSGMREENMAGGGDFCLEGNAMIVVFCYSCPEDFLMGRLEKFFVGYWNFFIGCMHYRATE